MRDQTDRREASGLFRRIYLAPFHVAIVKGLLALLFIAALWTAPRIHGASAGGPLTFTVNVLTDALDDTPGDGVCDTVALSGECSLRAAIQEANTAGQPVTIVFDVPNPAVINLTNSLPAIATSITIVGDGMGLLTIDGGDAWRPFQVNAGANVILRDLAIENGEVAGMNVGGAIRVAFGSLLLERIRLADNNAEGCGGAIHVGANGQLMVSDSDLINNRSTTMYGGAICNQGGMVEINDSWLHNNTAGAYGGGIYMSGGTLTINNSLVDGGSAQDGSGIYAVGGTITLNDSTMRTNSASSVAGAIYFSDGTLIATGTIFEENLANLAAGLYLDGVTATLENVTLRDNQATSFAGGIYIYESDIDIYDSDLIDNRTLNGSSGGMYAYDSQIDIRRTMFDGNQVSNTQSAGAIFNEEGALTIRESYFVDNRALLGGAIRSSGSLTIEQSTFAGNGIPDSSGGALLLGYPAIINNSTFSGNMADLGGAIYAGGSSDNTQINHSTLAFNNASTDGAGVFVAAGATLFIQDSIVGPNAAPGAGGDCAIAVTGVLSAVGANLDSDGTCPSFTLQNQNPALGALTDNGGHTLTHLPGASSPALDVGTSDGCAVVDYLDQRGFARTDGACDLGAVERGAGPPVTVTPTATPTMTRTPTSTPTMTRTPTRTPTMTRTPSATPSVTATATRTRTPTASATTTATASSTTTTTATSVGTASSTATGTPTRTATPTITASPVGPADHTLYLPIVQR